MPTNGWTALTWAYFKQHEEIVVQSLEKGANVKAIERCETSRNANDRPNIIEVGPSRVLEKDIF